MVDRIFEIQPYQPDAMQIDISISLGMLNLEEALFKARSAVFRHPNHPGLRYVLGISLSTAGQTKDAEVEFDNYIKMSPRLSPSRTQDLAIHYVHVGRADKALKILTDLEGEYTGTGTYSFAVAVAQARLGNYEEARQRVDKALKTWWPWGNLQWVKPFFQAFSDSSVFEKYADAMRKAGLPDWPFGLDQKLAGQRVTPNAMGGILTSNLQDVVDPFGRNLKLRFNKDGTWNMSLLSVPGTWRIIDGKICTRNPSAYMGREVCSLLFRDQASETKKQKAYILLGPDGPYKFKIARIAR